MGKITVIRGKAKKRPLLENDTEKERVIAGLQRQVDEQRLKNKEMEAQFKVPAGHRQGISLELQEILDNFRSPKRFPETSDLAEFDSDPSKH